MQKIAYFFISAIAIVIILIYGKSLLIPFVFALLLWFIMREIKQLMDKAKFIREKIPSWIKSLLAAIIILTVLAVISKIISTSVKTLAGSYSQYNDNVVNVVHSINEIFNIDLKDEMKDFSADANLGKLLGSIFNSITEILGSTFMIIIYALFIFLEESHFLNKVKYVANGNGQFEKFEGMVERIESSIEKYLRLKTMTSLTTGMLSYFVLLFIGIDAPIFWAFLIFLLNYIPTIGSLIATTFPAAYCLLQFGHFNEALTVLVFIASIQVLVGNILEPKLMGNSMNISPLVAIIALTFWGAIWGVTGMFLSIPITVVIMIILSQFESTRPIAIMLSEKGKIEPVDPTEKI